MSNLPNTQEWGENGQKSFVGTGVGSWASGGGDTLFSIICLPSSHHTSCLILPLPLVSMRFGLAGVGAPGPHP